MEAETKAEETKRWRKKKESDSEDEESEESGGSEESEDDSGSESESDNRQKGARTHGLIEIENPNRVQKKQVLKVSAMKVDEDEGWSKLLKLAKVLKLSYFIDSRIFLKSCSY